MCIYGTRQHPCFYNLIFSYHIMVLKRIHVDTCSHHFQSQDSPLGVFHIMVNLFPVGGHLGYVLFSSITNCYSQHPYLAFLCTNAKSLSKGLNQKWNCWVIRHVNFTFAREGMWGCSLQWGNGQPHLTALGPFAAILHPGLDSSRPWGFFIPIDINIEASWFLFRW